MAKKAHIRNEIRLTFEAAQEKAIELRAMLIWLDEAVAVMTGKSVYKLSDSNDINTQIYHSLEDGLDKFDHNVFMDILDNEISKQNSCR